jgi:hypothetical protein
LVPRSFFPLSLFLSGGGGGKGKGRGGGNSVDDKDKGGGKGKGVGKGKGKGGGGHDDTKYQKRSLGTNAHKFDENSGLSEDYSVAVLVDNDEDENGYGQGVGIYHGEIGLQSMNFEREWGEQAETAESYFPPGTLDIDYGELASSLSAAKAKEATPELEDVILNQIVLDNAPSRCRAGGGALLRGY